MATLEYRSFAELKEDIQALVDDALKYEVADAIKDCEALTIEKVVYDVYSPNTYERREYEGGLADPENMVEYVKNGTLTVDNLTEFNQYPASSNSGIGLAELVEYGDGGGGYHYDYGRPGAEFKHPRPFTQETINTLKSSKLHVEVLKKALRARGLDVK